MTDQMFFKLGFKGLMERVARRHPEYMKPTEDPILQPSEETVDIRKIFKPSPSDGVVSATSFNSMLDILGEDDQSQGFHRSSFFLKGTIGRKHGNVTRDELRVAKEKLRYMGLSDSSPYQLVDKLSESAPLGL